MNATETAPIMESADLAVMAGGMTVFETAALGIPALILQIAENQKMIAAAWQQSGYAVDLGPLEDLHAEILRKRVSDLMNNTELRRAMSMQAGAWWTVWGPVELPGPFSLPESNKGLESMKTRIIDWREADPDQLRDLYARFPYPPYFGSPLSTIDCRLTGFTRSWRRLKRIQAPSWRVLLVTGFSVPLSCGERRISPITSASKLPRLPTRPLPVTVMQITFPSSI